MSRDSIDETRGMDATTNPVSEAIGMDARVKTTPTLPPDGEQLSHEHRSGVLAALAAHCKRSGITQREVAIAINYDASTLNAVIKRKYPGDTDRVIRAIASYIEDDLVRRGQRTPIGWFATSVFESIRALAHYAKSNALGGADLAPRAATAERPRICIGYGPAGCGKTAGAKAYTIYDPRSIYVRMGEDLRRVSSFSVELYHAIVARDSRPQQSALRYCIHALRGSQRLLIIDEGHTLNFAICEFVRTLVDKTGIPCVILATQEFYDRITRVRRREGVYQYDQFSSRVGYTIDLLRGSDGKGGKARPYFSLEEIAAIYRRDNVRISRDGLELLQAIASTVGLGMLRTAAAVFDKAARAATRKNNGLVTADLLLSAIDSSLVPAGVADAEFRHRITHQLATNRKLNTAAPRRAAAG